MREDIEAADASQLGATLTRDLARPIVDLNMGPRRRYPRICLKRPDQEDVGKLVENVTKLVPFGLRVERSWMADKVGVPDPDKGAELLTAPKQTATQTPNQTQTEEPEPEETAAQATADEGDDIDKIVQRLSAATGPAMDRTIDQVRALVMDGSITTLEKLSARLIDLYPGMDLSEVAERLADAMLVAHLAGEDEANG